MRTIQDVQLGETVDHGIKGKGMVCGKTPRTITIQFEKSRVKNTYRHKDDYFYISDF